MKKNEKNEKKLKKNKKTENDRTAISPPPDASFFPSGEYDMCKTASV
jgi:hypothetical protein